jgi:hypothetical protein
MNPRGGDFFFGIVVLRSASIRARGQCRSDARAATPTQRIAQRALEVPECRIAGHAVFL